jgi:hypothetical protein
LVPLGGVGVPPEAVSGGTLTLNNAIIHVFFGTGYHKQRIHVLLNLTGKHGRGTFLRQLDVKLVQFYQLLLCKYV